MGEGVASCVSGVVTECGGGACVYTGVCTMYFSIRARMCVHIYCYCMDVVYTCVLLFSVLFCACTSCILQGSGAWSAEVPTARASPGGSGGGGWSSSSSSSRSSQGGGRGGGDVESGNGSSSSSYAYKPVPSAPPANEESFFPGGGRTLAASSSSSSSSSGSGAGGDGGWMRGSSGGGGDSVAAVRAARLAALEGRSSSAASSSHEAPSSLPVATVRNSDPDMCVKLREGFPISITEKLSLFFSQLYDLRIVRNNIQTHAGTCQCGYSFSLSNSL